MNIINWLNAIIWATIISIPFSYGMLLREFSSYVSNNVNIAYNKGNIIHCAFIFFITSFIIHFILAKLIKFATWCKYWLLTVIGLDIPHLIVDFILCFLVVSFSFLALHMTDKSDSEN